MLEAEVGNEDLEDGQATPVGKDVDSGDSSIDEAEAKEIEQESFEQAIANSLAEIPGANDQAEFKSQFDAVNLLADTMEGSDLD